MENLTNQILDLANGQKYFVLRQAVYKGNTYFLAAQVTDEEDNFTNDFLFLQKIEGEEFKVKKVTDKNIIEVLAKNIKIE